MKELNDRARALLQATQFADEPSVEDFDRVHAAVVARIAGAAAVGAAATLGAKTATAATTATASAATTATAGGAALAGASIAPAAATAGAALPVMKITAWVLAVSMTAGVGSAVVVKRARTQSSVAAVATVAAPASPAVTSVNPPPPSVRRAESHEEAPAAAPPPAVAQPSPQANAWRPVATPLHPSEPIEPGEGAPQKRQADSLEAEVALIRDARAALQANDPARALTLLEEHARRFPRGSLLQDRDALQVFATCAAGQNDAARELAAAFLSRHPGSSYASAVRTSCAGKK